MSLWFYIWLHWVVYACPLLLQIKPSEHLLSKLLIVILQSAHFDLNLALLYSLYSAVRVPEEPIVVGDIFNFYCWPLADCSTRWVD